LDISGATSVLPAPVSGPLDELPLSLPEDELPQAATEIVSASAVPTLRSLLVTRISLVWWAIWASHSQRLPSSLLPACIEFVKKM
jgi:hypothetical protein